MVPADKAGIWGVRVIHTYTKLSRMLLLSNFGKISIRYTAPHASLLKKKKKKFLYVRPGYMPYRKCGLSFQACRAALLLKKRLTPFGRRVSGFLAHEVRRRKAEASFVKIL